MHSQASLLGIVEVYKVCYSQAWIQRLDAWGLLSQVLACLPQTWASQASRTPGRKATLTTVAHFLPTVRTTCVTVCVCGQVCECVRNQLALIGVCFCVSLSASLGFAT